MAFDKVIDSAVLDANLIAVADAIRDKTGEADSLSFPAGMVDAIARISAGAGGMSMVSGTFTPAEDTDECRITGLGGSPSAFVVAPAFTNEEAVNGVPKLLCAIWFHGVFAFFRTNASGLSVALEKNNIYDFESFEIQEDDCTPFDGVAALKTGLYVRRNSYFFRAGLTYCWAAII